MTKNLFIKVFMMHRSRLVIFYFKEKFCVSHASTMRFRDVYLLFVESVRSTLSKKIISGCFWFELFIQMVKCSLLDEKIVYQSFYGVPLTFSYFLLQGKVPSFARVDKSLARCLFQKRSEDLVEKIISPVLFDTNRSLK